MFQKLYEVLEGTTALVALLAIIGVSTFSVLALNPNISSDVQADQEVAGAFTQVLNKPKTQLLINNLSSGDSNYSSELISLGYEQGYEYKAQIKPAQILTEKKFIEVHNASANNSLLNFDLEIIGAVQDEIKVRVFDDLDTLVLYSPETGINKVSLTIPANSKRTLNIQYELLENINFSFEVKIKLN